MLRFLQVSDIHFRGGADEEALDYELRELLIEDARSAVEQEGGVSGILVCGDLANGGSGSEFVQASTWLQSLCSAIGVPPWMIWVVPGNHDIDRTRLGEGQIELRRRLRSAADSQEAAAMFAAVLANSDEREILLEPLYNYIEFASAYDCIVGPALHWNASLEMEGAELHIRGLTSAMLCGSGDNTTSHRLVIGDEQANIDVQDGTVYYTLCHHPPCWLMDRTEIEDWFSERVQVRVTGHLHVRSLSSTPAGVHVRAGAVSPRRRDGSYVESELPRYELISIEAVEHGDQTKVDIVVRGRLWNDTDGLWMADETEEGTFARRYELGRVSCGEDIPLPGPAPATVLNLPERELRYRLAQLQPYDRQQCARQIKGPLQAVMDAPPHLEVAVLFDWARHHNRLGDLRNAVERAVQEPQGQGSDGGHG